MQKVMSVRLELQPKQKNIDEARNLIKPMSDEMKKKI